MNRIDPEQEYRDRLAAFLMDADLVREAISEISEWDLAVVIHAAARNDDLIIGERIRRQIESYCSRIAERHDEYSLARARRL